MRKVLLFSLMVSASPLHAERWVADAFGLVPEVAAGPRTTWAGHVETLAFADRNAAYRTAGPVDQLAFFLGAKSLRAGAQPGQAAVVAFDAAGNLAADGTDVTFTLGDTRLRDVTGGGIAARDITPGTRAGLFLAGASSGTRQTYRAEYEVVADHATAGLVPPQTAGRLKAETLTPVDLGAPSDRFGNALEDGIGLNLTVTHTDGSVSVVPAVTVGGKVEATVLSRDMPQEGSAVSTLGSIQSEAADLRVDAGQPAGQLEATATALADVDASQFEIGPFLTTEGYVLSDGATVSVELTDARGQRDTFTGWVRDGYLRETRLISPEAFPVNAVVWSALGRQEALFASASEVTQ